MKIAVVTPIPTPYRDPFWNAVADTTDIELSVYYCSAGKGDRPWQIDWDLNYRAKVLPGRNLARFRSRDASCYFNPSIVANLREGKYDAIVVAGYNHPTMWQAMRFAHKRDLPFYLMSESHLNTRRGSWKALVKRRPVEWVVTRARGGFPTGTLATRYLTHFGAASDSLVQIPNVPDVEQLQFQASQLRANRSLLRQSAKLAEVPTILFAGRLIAKKRADLLIRAFAEIHGDTGAQLVIVGDGEERQRLEQLATQLGVAQLVRFIGFVQPKQMSNWYALADLFVLPSSETWGVVVLEALASGVPVITTDEVGCYPDVVTDSVQGSVVPARDISALTSAMLSQLARRSDCDTVRRSWSDVFDRMRYPRLAIAFADLIQGKSALSLPTAA